VLQAAHLEMAVTDHAAPFLDKPHKTAILHAIKQDKIPELQYGATWVSTTLGDLPWQVADYGSTSEGVERQELHVLLVAALVSAEQKGERAETQTGPTTYLPHADGFSVENYVPKPKATAPSRGGQPTSLTGAAWQIANHVCTGPSVWSPDKPVARALLVLQTALEIMQKQGRAYAAAAADSVRPDHEGCLQDHDQHQADVRILGRLQRILHETAKPWADIPPTADIKRQFIPARHYRLSDDDNYVPQEADVMAPAIIKGTLQKELMANIILAGFAYQSSLDVTSVQEALDRSWIAIHDDDY
jgi:hypothetical protein